MQIDSSTFVRTPSRPKANMVAKPPEESMPQDTFTFSEGNQNKGALVMLGFGVSVTGLIAGAQIDNPAVMMGSFMAGAAIIVAASR